MVFDPIRSIREQTVRSLSKHPSCLIVVFFRGISQNKIDLNCSGGPSMSPIDTMSLPKDIDHTRGPLSATLIMVTYGNYQCPQSGQAHQAIERLRHSYGDQFCFIFRHFPRTDLHPQSQKAAVTAEAAGSQGKFWEMHDKLFENQQALDDASLVEYADELDLDIGQFLQEIGTHSHISSIQKNVECAQQNGVHETPTSFISVRHSSTDDLEEVLHQILSVIQENSNGIAGARETDTTNRQKP